MLHDTEYVATVMKMKLIVRINKLQQKKNDSHKLK